MNVTYPHLFLALELPNIISVRTMKQCLFANSELCSEKIEETSMDPVSKNQANYSVVG